MSRTTQLLIVDPQNDFCDLPRDGWPAGQAPSLPVQGAHADMQRLAGWIQRYSPQIDAITITLDSHQAYDIAHPWFWQQGHGGPVAPFTPITAAQVRAGDFAPRDASALPRVLQYLDALEDAGRYTLMVWPMHCELGSWGHGVHPDVLQACRDWQAAQHRAVHHVLKGMNPWTEHYSAICAEVPDPQDPATSLNTALLERLSVCDTLVITGEASSHCVRATTEHILQHSGMAPERLVVLTDCMSPVAGFELAHEIFLQQMRQQGVRCTSSTVFHL